MPAPLARGIIITVSVIVAAGLAAYENPQVRQWIDQSRQKIAMALHSLGDDIHPRSRSPRQDDPSMREDASEMAETRRQQARVEILERGRIMEERRKRRKTEHERDRQGSFDSMVDRDGVLKEHEAQQSEAVTTSIDAQGSSGILTNRQNVAVVSALHKSVDSPISLRQLDLGEQSAQVEADPFASTYEQEMRNAWNMPLVEQPRLILSSHASESLIDLTPTSENAPDPDVSVPDITHLDHPLDRSEYFSATASASSHTLSTDEPEYYYAHPHNVLQPLPIQGPRQSRLEVSVPVSSAPSIAGSTDHVHASDLDESDDGILSDFGDGVRTPASAWTEVGSTVSSDAGH